MPSMKRLAALAALCVAAAAQAAPPTKAVQLSKVVINPDIPKENQRIKVGTICLFGGPPVDFGSRERTLNQERFERLFSSTMAKRGFTVINKSADLFSSEETRGQADYLIGATVKPTFVQICDSADGYKGNVKAMVEWKIFDRATKTIVETISIEGLGQQEKFLVDGINVMFDNAFAASLNALIDQGIVAKYLGPAAVVGTP